MNQKVDTVALFGLPISNVTMAEAVERIAAGIDAGASQQVATANLDFARNAQRDPYLHQVLCDCSMVLPDGAPMLWAAKIYGKSLKQRVTGVDLIPELAKLSAKRGYKIFTLGSTERNAKNAVALLSMRYPGVNFVGHFSPTNRPLDKMKDDEILTQIHKAKPDILLVAFGHPKQELWIDRNRELLNVPVTIGIGGSLDMIAGDLKRAPKFLQKMQLEWAFRMLQEPRRLLPRYFNDFVALVKILPAQVLAIRRQPEKMNNWPVEVTKEEGTRVVHLPVVLSGEECPKVLKEVFGTVDAGERLVFDMVLTERIGADGVGCLLEARRMMIAAGLPFWLAGVGGPVRRVLQTSSLVQHIRMAGTAHEAVKLSGMPERRSRPVASTGSQRVGEESRRRMVAVKQPSVTVRVQAQH